MEIEVLLDFKHLFNLVAEHNERDCSNWCLPYSQGTSSDKSQRVMISTEFILYFNLSTIRDEREYMVHMFRVQIGTHARRLKHEMYMCIMFLGYNGTRPRVDKIQQSIIIQLRIRQYTKDIRLTTLERPPQW